jgi:hypothetical protein
MKLGNLLDIDLDEGWDKIGRRYAKKS